MPAIIQLSGGGTGGSTQNGTGSVISTIPVGAAITCSVSGPSGYVVNDETVIWGGGSNISSYDPGDPNQPPPTHAGPTGAPYTNNPTYAFIVDADPRTYTITVNVGYTNGASGSATITFTSAKPPYTWNVQQPGQISTIYSNYVNGNATELVLGELVNPNQNVNMSTLLDADTGAIACGQDGFQGNCMFLQLINATISVTQQNNNNQLVTSTLNTNGSVIDDGFPGSGAAPLGQPTTQGYREWEMTFSPTEGTFTDSPSYTLQNVFAKSVSMTESFQTYLMYQPEGGDWVALSEYQWNFQITQTNTAFANNGVNWTNTSLTQPNPTQSTPSGLNAFPSWYSDSQSATVTNS
jgi:hypothetical protein